MGPTLIKHDPRREVFRASPEAAYMRDYFCPLLEKTGTMRARATGTMDAVFMAATILFGDTRAALRGRRKTHPLLHHRQMMMAAAVGLGRLSYPQVGRAVDAHHTTVLHAVKRVAAAHDWAWEKGPFKATCLRQIGEDGANDDDKARDQSVWQICSGVAGLAYGVDPLRLRYPGHDAHAPGPVREARQAALALLGLIYSDTAAPVAFVRRGEVNAAIAIAFDLCECDPVYAARFTSMKTRAASALQSEVA